VIEFRFDNREFKRMRSLALIASVLSLAIFWFQGARLQDGRGNPAAWGPSIILLIGAMAAMINFHLQSRMPGALPDNVRAFEWIVVSILGLWLSADFVGNIYSGLMRVFAGGNFRLAGAAIALTFVAIGWMLLRGFNQRMALVCAFVIECGRLAPFVKVNQALRVCAAFIFTVLTLEAMRKMMRNT